MSGSALAALMKSLLQADAKSWFERLRRETKINNEEMTMAYLKKHFFEEYGTNQLRKERLAREHKQKSDETAAKYVNDKLTLIRQVGRRFGTEEIILWLYEGLNDAYRPHMKQWQPTILKEKTEKEALNTFKTHLTIAMEQLEEREHHLLQMTTAQPSKQTVPKQIENSGQPERSRADKFRSPRSPTQRRRRSSNEERGYRRPESGNRMRRNSGGSTNSGNMPYSHFWGQRVQSNQCLICKSEGHRAAHCPLLGQMQQMAGKAIAQGNLENVLKDHRVELVPVNPSQHSNTGRCRSQSQHVHQVMQDKEEVKGVIAAGIRLVTTTFSNQ